MVTARIGTGVRSAATLREVNPPDVSVTMSGVLSIRATALVPMAIASSTETVSPGVSRRSSRAPTPMAGPCRSVSRMMRSIARTASKGYSPTAVSADSMTASVPSRMALATSDASARVGRGWCTIDSSIWVAVITGLP